MSMRIHKLATHLGTEEAFVLIEFIDQLRDTLMQAYGNEIGAMLQQLGAPPPSTEIIDDEVPF
jgi:hypothetical protein